MADRQSGRQFLRDTAQACGYMAAHHHHSADTDSTIMSGFREPGFADRQKAAQQAKQAILEKFRAQPGPDDPAVKQRQAEREAQAEARAKAREAREAAKAARKAEEERLAAEAAIQFAREKEEA